jgi:hypothetical protein
MTKWTSRWHDKAVYLIGWRPPRVKGTAVQKHKYLLSKQLFISIWCMHRVKSAFLALGEQRRRRLAILRQSNLHSRTGPNAPPTRHASTRLDDNVARYAIVLKSSHLQEVEDGARRTKWYLCGVHSPVVKHQDVEHDVNH